jgi:hypothetical protein
MSTYRGEHAVSIYGSIVTLNVIVEYTYTKRQPYVMGYRYEPPDPGGLEIESITSTINDQIIRLDLCDDLVDAVAKAIYEERTHMNLEDA